MRIFGMDGTLSKMLTGPVTKIATKVTVYAYGCYIKRLLGRPQGCTKELWAWKAHNTHLALQL